MAEAKIEKRPASKVALTFTIPAEKISDAYSKQISEYAKKVTIKGFRKGKAPLSVIERQLGEYLLEDAVYGLIDEVYQEEIEKLDEADKPISYSHPTLENEKDLKPFSKDKDVTVTIVYDVFPAVELGQHTGLSFDIPNVQVTEKDIEEEIDALREQNSSILTKDGAAVTGDIVTVDYAELDEDGKAIESTSRNDFTFTIGSTFNQYKIDEDLVGMKAGDEKVITKTYDESEDDEALRGRTVKLSVKVTKVKERSLPEVDDEFAQDVKDEYKTVEDLKNGIKTDLENNMNEMLKNDKFKLVMDEIKKTSTFEVPEAMRSFALDRATIDYLRQMGRNNEEIEKMQRSGNPIFNYVQTMVRDQAYSNLDNEIIMDAIQKAGVITVPEADLEEACNKRITDDMDEETKERAKAEIKDTLAYSRVPDYLFENNKFNPSGDVKGYHEYVTDYYKRLYEQPAWADEEVGEEENKSDDAE